MAGFIYTVQQGGAEEVKKQNLTSQIDGEKTTFLIQEEYKTGTLRVYYNGVRQVESETFSETTSTTFTTTFLTIPGDYLTIDYTPN
tara:strand:- start:855 stop:1112 length:258 start_codon:yes stop_codon:yes gene_type:complete